MKTGSESIEVKCVVLEELVEGAGCVGRGRKNSGRGASWTTSELSVSTLTSGQMQPRTRENGARRWEKGRKVSWRDGSL